MTIKILPLCVIVCSSFKEFVEFSLTVVSAIAKMAITNKTLVKTIFSTVTLFCQYVFRIFNLHYLNQKFHTLS